ncbi:MAG: M24 family metallopeptidase [Actinobacteria bacterium]|nr:M24 family metallopeptidase [Actinomycetota bacterium]
MTTYLLVDDALRSPELRHEIAEGVGDPMIFIEHDGRRIVVGSILEQTTFEKREDIVDEYWTFNDLGIEELIKNESFPKDSMIDELTVRALERLGVFAVSVPGNFRLATADYLRDKGVDIAIEIDEWKMRRRRKTPWEIEGIERAQRAADTAMLTAARMLRDAEPTADGRLRFEGEILSAELIRIAMQAELLDGGAYSEEILVQCGDAALNGHDLGAGPIMADHSVVIDVFPKDRRTTCWSDMTRTYVSGTPSEELRNLHAHVRKALDIAFDALRPGASNAHQAVADYFNDQGFPTASHHQGPDPLREGFFHSLGHGIGLQTHEPPALGRRPDELIEGDVVAVEPGLYFPGIGGVRLEDTVVITSDGIEHFTEPLPYDLEP